MQTKESIEEKIKELRKKRNETLEKNLDNVALQYSMALIYLEWVLEV